LKTGSSNARINAKVIMERKTRGFILLSDFFSYGQGLDYLAVNRLESHGYFGLYTSFQYIDKNLPIWPQLSSHPDIRVRTGQEQAGAMVPEKGLRGSGSTRSGSPGMVVRQGGLDYIRVPSKESPQLPIARLWSE
jgi:hypothetical protein